MAEKFAGFANAPVDKKGKRLDFRTVEAYVDETDEGQAVEASRRTPSSITQFKTDDKATNGAPAAVVPEPKPKGAQAAEGEEAKSS